MFVFALVVCTWYHSREITAKMNVKELLPSFLGDLHIQALHLILYPFRIIFVCKIKIGVLFHSFAHGCSVFPAGCCEDFFSVKLYHTTIYKIGSF